MVELLAEDLTADAAAESFAALGAPVRLAILRALVRAGPAGLPVGALREKLDLPASTLSHHLKALIAADIVQQHREGRVLRCFASYDMITSLAAFLLGECCADAGATMQTKVETV